MTTPRSIVIVKLSAIGDVLHGVPVAVALKRAFPDTRVGWAVEGRAADVLAGHPAIDHLFRLPRGWLKSPRTVLSLRRQLRWFGADVAIDLQGLMKSGVVTALSTAAIRIGHARPESREWSWLASTHPVTSSEAHVIDRNLALLAPLGIAAADVGFDMPQWPVSRLRVTRWLQSLRLPRPPVLFNPGAGWPSKRWPVERFSAAARAVSRRDGQPVIVVWGGDQERAAAERIVADAAGGAVAAPATSLQDLGELCRLSRVFVSGDTGPLHLAAAVGAPCVGLFGPVPASRNGPYGRGHVCVEPPADARPPWDERKTDMAAMRAIDVDLVVAATETAIARSQAA
jgi:heptosyltransferase-1